MNFYHFSPEGDARMVDVSKKAHTHRRAVAAGQIHMMANTLEQIYHNNIHKGDVLGVARIAGILGAKRTAELIPLCHPLALTHIAIDFLPCHTNSMIYCQATVETHGQTGVEMEALCAVQISLLTIYDMCKAIDRSMILTEICLLEKDGGVSGHYEVNYGI